MPNFRNKLQKWTVVSQGDNNDDSGGGGRGGGSISSSMKLLTLDSEFTREPPRPLLSVWKPVWYTGWHTGVLACATSVVVVLFINVGLTIYAATNPEHKMEGGIGTLYEGSCDKSRTIGLWLHLGINVLSTLLLSGSNYTQQCLAAPTRSEIDAAHAKRQWMDIGVPSIRNLFRIKLERTLLWIAIGFTSIPLHLLYNSIVYTSLSANDFLVSVVTKDHFELGAYSNLDKAGLRTAWPVGNTGHNYPTGEEYLDSHDFRLFRSMLQGNSSSTVRYEDLSPFEYINLYNTDLVSSHRNLFLMTSPSSNTTKNNTVLDIEIEIVEGGDKSPGNWMCNYRGRNTTQPFLSNSSECTPSKLFRHVKSGLPWRVKLERAGEVEISRCKCERTAEKCKVQFSLGIMIVVICCNLVKACGMIMTVARSQEPTLVTLGDAVGSFLSVPDPTTMGICFADRQFIKREWRRGWRTEPRQWKQKGAQRWWTSVSRTR
ncbi:hypothetical protein B9Z19DRAFT_1127461 [Tuber borchii]|uniref:DUF6536 domain-containing protein n=1 Tax=Tuber borchii TaxID=42251 RepID=A0A2T6ZR67_TUBBO|nr:hypothetical protein B9Z19DRAFT_1127461 [Tuber borchii]